MPDFLIWPGLVLLGVAVGAYGTLVGAGGGFILVPLLLVLYPNESPELVTSISLGVVFCNALAGTAAFIYQRRVDFLAGNSFALATLPGAIAGALVSGKVPRDLFDGIFALLLLTVAALLILRPQPRVTGRVHRRGEVSRLHTDSHGDTYSYSYSLRLGILLSLAVGFLSSLLGIGGGLVQVPVLVQLLHFPVLIATATSQYVLTMTAGAAALVHLIAGDYAAGYLRTVALAAGVVVGAPIGAVFSYRLRGPVIVRLMAGALVILATRLITATL